MFLWSSCLSPLFRQKQPLADAVRLISAQELRAADPQPGGPLSGCHALSRLWVRVARCHGTTCGDHRVGAGIAHTSVDPLAGVRPPDRYALALYQSPK